MSAALLWCVTGIYAVVGIDQAVRGNGPLSMVFAGYVVANLGLIWAMR